MPIATATQNLIKAYTDRKYKHTTMVRHKGTVVAFAMDDEQRIYYSMLDLGEQDRTKGELDVNYWAETPSELHFPDEISQVGYGLAGATRVPIVAKDSGTEPDAPESLQPDEVDLFMSTTARLTADAPFQVLSDNRYVYVFRQSVAGSHSRMIYKLRDGGASAATVKAAGAYVTDKDGDKVPLVSSALLLDRFVLANAVLKPRMEIRYRRSRNKTQPAGRKDSLGAKDMEEKYFFEPTQELDFIRNLCDGRFQVLLLPTQVADVQRWQIFAHNASTGRIDSFNVERSLDGLFNTKGTQLYTSPEARFQSSVLERQPGICPFTNKALIPKVSTEGYAETALSFDGSNDHVTITGYEGITGDGARTVEAWIKTTAQAQAVVSWGSQSNSQEWTFRIQGGSNHPGALRADVRGGHVLGTKAVNDGKWHHVACVLAKGGSVNVEDVKLYVDGELDENSDSASRAVDTASGGDVRIGRDFDDRCFDGQIDEVRIWDRARNPDEIRDERQHRLVGNESGLAGYWRFDEGAGTQVYDQTDNARLGVIEGAIWIDSEAPIGDHPGMRRSSITLAGRTVESGLSALLYYQQEDLRSGYDEQAKPMKQNARVMLAAATGGPDADGNETDKKHVAALDFAVSRDGKLALVPDSITLPAITNAGTSNEQLDEIAQLQSAISSLEHDVRELNESIRGLRDRPSEELRELIADSSVQALCGTRTKLLGTTRLYDEIPERYDAESIEINRHGGQIEVLEIATDSTFVERRRDHAPPVGGSRFHESAVSSQLIGNDCYIDKVKWHGVSPATAGYVIYKTRDGRDRAYEIEGYLNQRRSRKQRELANKTARYQALQNIEHGQAAFMPLLHLDRAGLSVSGGLLYFAYANDAPQLFDSATARLALYFQGKNRQFFAAYFDTRTARAVKQIAMDSDVVSFLARTAGKEMDEATINVTNGASAETCTLGISNFAHRIIETWREVPRAPQKLAAVLNGEASEKIFVGKVRETSGTVTSLSLTEGVNRALDAGSTLRIGDTKVTTSAAVVTGATSIAVDSAAVAADAGTAIYLLSYDYANVAAMKLFDLGEVESATISDVGLRLVNGSTEAVANGSTLIVGNSEVTTRQAVAAGATEVPITGHGPTVEPRSTQAFVNKSIATVGNSFQAVTELTLDWRPEILGWPMETSVAIRAGASLRVGDVEVTVSSAAEAGQPIPVDSIDLTLTEQTRVELAALGLVDTLLPDPSDPQKVSGLLLRSPGVSMSVPEGTTLSVGGVTVRTQRGVGVGEVEISIEPTSTEAIGQAIGAEIGWQNPDLGTVGGVKSTRSSIPLAAGLTSGLADGTMLLIGGREATVDGAVAAGATSLPITSKDLTLRPAATVYRKVLIGTVEALTGETRLTLVAAIDSAVHAETPLLVGRTVALTRGDVEAGAKTVTVQLMAPIPEPGTLVYSSRVTPGYALQRGSTQFTAHAGTATKWVKNGNATGPGDTPTCQWVADAPGRALQFDGEDDYLAVETAKAGQTATDDDLTMEAWVKPLEVNGTARVIHHQSDRSSYTLGMREDLKSALELDGAGDYVEVAASLLNDLTAFTIEGWIRLTEASGSKLSLFGQNDAIEFGIDSTNLMVWTEGGDTQCAHGISTGVWHHVAAVGDGQNLKLFVDGVEKGSGGSAAGSGYGSSTAKFKMGAGVWSDGATNALKGRIDEVRVWGHARDADDIQADMNRRLGGHEPGLMGYWHFENKMATDHSGNGNHGALKGDPQIATSPFNSYRLFAGIGDRFAQSSEVNLSRSWNHLAATFRQSYALRFDGNDHLECKHDTTLNLQDLTLEAVVKLDAVEDAGLIAKGSLRGGAPGQNVPYALSIRNGQIHFAFEDENARLVEVRSEMSDPLVPETVYEIAVTRENITATSSVGYADGSSMLGTNAPPFDDIDNEAKLGENDAKLEKSMKADYVAGKQRKKQLQPSASGFQFASGSVVTQSTEIKMYVDGEQVHSQGLSPVKSGRNTDLLTIGRVGTRYCNGIISEARLWSKALGPGELGQTLTGSEEGLFSWWRFEESEGNVAHDAKGGQHALVKGAQWVENPIPEASPLVLYCNGSAVHTEDVGKTDALRTASWGNDQFTLGARKANQYYDEFAGEMEEVRVWKVARTQEQILDNLFTRLRGEKQDLLANYTFDEEDDGEVKDHSLLCNHLPFGQASTRPSRVLSTAPISNDAAQVRSALAGVKTAFHELIDSSPAVAEYGETQYDSEGNLIGVMKRCYGYVQNGEWQLITGYKVGNLVTEWIGQAQFDPQIMGFIEGAPPVPSENLTPGPVTLYGNYENTSSVEFAEADDVVYTYSSTKESGYDSSFEVSGSLGGSLDLRALLAPLGFGISQKIDVSVSATGGAAFESAGSWSDGRTVSSGQNVTRAMKASLGGNWEDPDDLLNPNLGRRFITTNRGFALVESKTADIFALRLAHNHALVSFRFEPNPDIPPDWNIIPFPINPRYTKQGTLDGKIGFQEDGSVQCDPSYPMASQYGEYSFFKPREAYLLKKRIDQEREKLRSYYESYDAAPLSRKTAAALGGVTGGLRAAGAAFPALGLASGAVATFGSVIAASATDQSVPDLASSRNIANTYVWTADGGTYAETHQTTNVKQESSSGSYSFSGTASAGFSLTVEAGATFGLEMNSSIGGSMNLTKSKSAEAANTFSIDVQASPPGNLQRYDEDLQPQYDVHSDPVNVPGKVDAYRFMTFYLESDKDNFDDLYAKVVDPIWLEQSDHPNAVAMRQANQSKKSPACWRIFHRVTFVSRLLPDFPDDTAPRLAKTMKAQNIESNWQLIQKLAPFVRNKTDNFAQFADATHDALATHLPEMLPHEQEILKYLALYFDVDESI